MPKIKKFGTFGGVFTPSILTILGVIMYLRFPMIIGQSGLWVTIGIILVAHLISVTTGLSVASIATDKKVKTGGTYYMISRSLGLPIGGTLGLALFAGLSFSVSLYLIGFAESFLNYFNFEVTKNSIRLAGTSILVLVTIITFISTSLAIKSQYIIMGAIALSLLSIVLGFSSHEFTPAAPQLKPLSDAAPFMLLFGIFFPAVTGFEAGVSMSGDLKDPKKSLPIGAIAAIAVGFIVYILLAIFFTYTVNSNELANNPNILFEISLFPELVIAGIWGATLSSALGSILGAPRILQATAMDKITPKIFAKGYGAGNEPRNALLLTFVIAEAGILIGDLDIIARIVSMFFITTYAFLNLASFIESWASSDFQPSFKIPKFFSLLGAVASLIVMILLDFVALAGAVMVLALLFFYLKRKELILDTGDAWSSFSARLVKNNLSKLTKDGLNIRNWRPNILLFSKNNIENENKSNFAQVLTGNFGIYSQIDIQIKSDKILSPIPINIPRTKGLANFKKAFKANNFIKAVSDISMIYGFPGIEPNTVFLDIVEDDKLPELLYSFQNNGLNTILFNPNFNISKTNTIDFWWQGKGSYLAFALSLYRQLQQSSVWRGSLLRVIHINDNCNSAETLHQTFTEIINNFRVQAEFKIIDNCIEKNDNIEIINAESKNTDFTILGISEKFFVKEKFKENFEKSFFLRNNSAIYFQASNKFESLAPNLFDKLDYSEKIEKTEKIEFTGVENSILNGVLFKVYNKFYNILNEFEAKYNDKSKAIFTNLVENYKSISSNTINEIIKAKNSNESVKLNSRISKIQSSYLFQIKKIIENTNKNYLSEEFKVCNTQVNKYLQNSGLLPEHLPKKLTIQKKKSIFLKESVRYYANYKTDILIEEYLNKYSIKIAKIFSQLIDTITNLNGDINRLLKQTDVDLELLKKEISSKFSDIERLLTEKDFEHIYSKFAENFNELAYIIQFAGRKELKLITKIKKEQIHISDIIKDKAISRYSSLIKINNSSLAEVHTLFTKNRLEKNNKELVSFIKATISEKITVKTDKILLEIEKKEPIDSSFIKFDNLSGNFIDYFINSYNNFRQYLQSLPDEIVLKDIYSDDKSDEKTIEYRKIVTNKLEDSFFDTAHKLILDLEQNVSKNIFSLQDTIRLYNFNISNADSYSDDLIDEETIIIETVDKLKKALPNSISKFKTFKQNIEIIITDTFDLLHVYSLLKETKSRQVKKGKFKSTKIYKSVNTLKNNIVNGSSKLIENIIYRQSDGIIFAEKFISQEEKTNIVYKISEEIEKLQVNQEINSKLPVSYLNLFSAKYTINNDLRIERTSELKKAKSTVSKHFRGENPALLIIGNPQSGKTDLANNIAYNYFSRANTVNIDAKRYDNIDINNIKTAIKRAFGNNADPKAILENIPENKIIIFDNAELWWQRANNGFVNLNYIFNLIETFSNRHFFVIIFNSHSYKFLQKYRQLDDYFSQIIKCKPVGAERIKQAIMLRHRAGGLTYSHKGRKTEYLARLTKASFFNNIFNHTQGNIGESLNVWKSSIKTFKNNNIEIINVSAFNSSVFDLLDNNKITIIVQICLHKKLKIKNLEQAFNLDITQFYTDVDVLKRSLVVIQENDDLFVNKVIENHLIKYLSNKKLL